jgi:hypothetical protein
MLAGITAREIISSDSEDEVAEVSPPPAKKAKFKFQAKYVFLTYSAIKMEDGTSQQPIPNKEVLFEHLKEFESNGTTVDGLVVAHELHENGSSHYHCHVRMNRRLVTHNHAIFDFMGVHPNVQAVLKINENIAYVVKGGDFVVDNVPLPATKPVKPAKANKVSLTPALNLPKPRY